MPTEREEHLKAIERVDSKLARLLGKRTLLLRRPRFATETIGLVRQALEESKRRGYNPYLTALALGEGIQSKALNDRRLRHLAPELLETARNGNEPFHFASVVTQGLRSGAVKEKHLPTLAPLLRKVIEKTRRAGWDPQPAALALSQALKSKRFGKYLKHLAPELLKTAEAGRNPVHLTEVVRAGAESRALRKEHLPALLPLLRQVLEETKRAGKDPTYLVRVLRERLRSGSLNSDQLLLMAPVFLETAQEGINPYHLAWQVSDALGSGRIKTNEELRAVLEHAKLAWQEDRGWAPDKLVVSAIGANREIGDLGQTLELQRHIIRRSGVFPLPERTIELWRKRRGE